MTQSQNQKPDDADEAAGMPSGKKPGPKDAPVQVRDAGRTSGEDKPDNWDKTDEAVDETFPASDSTAKY